MQIQQQHIQKQASSLSLLNSNNFHVNSTPSAQKQSQDKFFITETNVKDNLNLPSNLANYSQGGQQLPKIKEKHTVSYGMLPMSYSELTSQMPKRKSAYDYKEQIDEMKQNLLTPWQKVVKKLQYPLQNYNYYDNLPVKPGVFIYKALVEKNYPLKQLKINIPETLCVFNGLYWITTNQSGRLEVKGNDFLPRNFFDKVRELSETAYKSQYLEPTHAAVIDRKWQQFPVSGAKSVQSWEKFNDTINYGPDSDSIIQQFVYSSAQKANTIRLFYYNPRAHQGQNQTVGYYITNNIHYQEASNRYRYEEKYTICSSRENSFEHFVMKGKVLEPYEYFAEQLVNFIFKVYGVRIEEIALDFIKDERDIIYFTDVNGFKVFEYEKINQLALLSEEQWVEKVKEEKGIYDRANNTVQCSLCRISYKKSEVTKIVTYKMLYELKNHLFKRGIFGFDYLEKVSESTQSCKVCDICYMLVVAEHELIEVEKLYAISQNIPLEEKVSKSAQINRVDTENIKGKLNQWRLLFYFQEFQDIQLQALKQRCKTSKLYLQVKLFDYYTVLEIDNIVTHSIIEQNQTTLSYAQTKREGDFSPSNKRLSSLYKLPTQFAVDAKRLSKKMTIDIINQNHQKTQQPKTAQVILKKLRTHFFFVENIDNLEYFLKNTEVEFRITDGPKWNKPLAFASAYPFTHFDVKQSKKTQDYVQRQNIPLHFFGSDIEPFYLLTTTGLKKDKEIKTEKMYLYHYNQVYFPDNTYYNSDPLPIEWLELFESRDYFLEIFQKEEDDNKNLGFTPFCSIKELNYLEPDFKGRWNVRQEAIITGFSDTRAIVQNCTDRLYPKPTSARSYRSNQNSTIMGGRQDESIKNFRLNSANPISRGRDNHQKNLLEKYKTANENSEFKENLNEETLLEEKEDSPLKLKLNTDPGVSNTLHSRNQNSSKNGGAVENTLSKDQLKLDINKIAERIHLASSQSVKNLENDQLRFNSAKQQQDFKIRPTQNMILMTNQRNNPAIQNNNSSSNNRNAYTQQLLFNAKQLINYQTLKNELPKVNLTKKKKRKSKQQSNIAQPYYPYDYYLQQNDQKGESQIKMLSMRAKSEKNLVRILAKSSRPVSAYKTPGLTLLTSIGENTINENQKYDHDKLKEGVEVITEELKEDQIANNSDEQNQDKIEILDQHKRNIRPISHYMNQNFFLAIQNFQNAKKNQRNLNENQASQNNQTPNNLQQQQLTQVQDMISAKQMKRPISAANLFRRQNNQFGAQASLLSMRNIFHVYDARPPSGIQSLLSQKEQKKKKPKKKIKLRRNQEEGYLNLNFYQNDQQNNYQDLNSPESLSFQLSQTQTQLHNPLQQNQNMKIMADHRLQTINGQSSNVHIVNQAAYKSQKNLQILRPESSQSTHLTSTRMSNLSNQQHLNSQNFNFQQRSLGVTPQSQAGVSLNTYQNYNSTIQSQSNQPNQFFSQILSQQSQQQQQEHENIQSVENKQNQQNDAGTGDIQIDSQTQSHALSSFVPSPTALQKEKMSKDQEKQNAQINIDYRQSDQLVEQKQ